MVSLLVFSQIFPAVSINIPVASVYKGKFVKVQVKFKQIEKMLIRWLLFSLSSTAPEPHPKIS